MSECAPYACLSFKEESEVKTRLLRGTLGRTVAVALLAALVPLPVLAAEKSPTSPAPGIKATVDRIVAREAAASKSVALARETQAAGPADKSQLDSGSFFKTPAGIICLAVVGAGVAYAAYSASHDRIHSVARQNQ
jgi:hypothetical protein